MLRSAAGDSSLFCGIGKVSGHHGDGQSAAPDLPRGRPDLVRRRVDADLGGAHAQRRVAVLHGEVRQSLQRHRGLGLVAERLGDPY